MLIILDPSLRSCSGHFLTYDKVIADEAARLGERCVVFAAHDVEPGVVGQLEMVPCFRFGLESPKGDTVVKRAFLTDLVAATNKVALEPRSRLFLHTTTHRQIEPAVQALELEKLRNCTLTILLRYSIAPNPNFPNAETVGLYRDALAVIPRLGMTDRVRLVTDSELLANEYRTITDLPIDLVPIPHASGNGSDHCPAAVRHLVYLGNARSTKGFQYLPYMVSRIRPALLSGAWKAELQANVMFRRDTESVTALCALRAEPVTLWEDELSLDAYSALLQRASLVVIPYQTLYYHSQTSGVFAEAIGHGKPVVVPRGTWMARELGDSGAGTLFAPGDRVDLAAAVSKAMQSVDELTVRAKQLQQSWATRHNPRTFVEHLLQPEAAQ